MRCTQKDIREKLGITRDTLRFYEQKGIIEPEIDPVNGYRYYDDWQVNLLWDCKHYQAMGFSLAEVLEILKTDSAGQLRERIEGRREALAQQIERERLQLEATELRIAQMDEAIAKLGRIGVTEFEGRVFVPAREDHGLMASTNGPAVALMNANLDVMLPLLHFPSVREDHFFWGYAATPAVFEQICDDATDTTGFTRIEGGRALETWVDAGERWNVSLRLFESLLAEASSRGLSPRGELCADLIARAHDADGGYHRYLHAYLPLAG